jgi:integrase
LSQWGEFQGRIEDNRLVTGQGLYVADIAPERMAHAVVVRAQVASARVTSIDTDAALASPRVLAVYTGKDLAADGLPDFPCGVELKRPNGQKAHQARRPVLVRDRIRGARWPDTRKTGIGHLPIADITRLDISTCLSDVRKRSPSQAHHALVLLSTIFKWALGTGYVDANPADGQPFYHRSPARVRYLSEQEIAPFWHGLEVDPYSAERYKGKRIHRIPVCPWPQEQVDAALRIGRSSAWLFASLGVFGSKSLSGRMNARTFTESMARLTARLKIPHATPHTLRHTVGSHLDRLGYSLEEIGLALGHKAKGTTARYVHDVDGRRAGARRRPILMVWEAEVRRIIEAHMQSRF